MKQVMIILTTMLLSSAALAQTKEIKALLDNEKALNGMCRGSTTLDEKQANAVCCGRDLTAARLNQLGWCYGTRGQTGDKMVWHRCTGASLRVNVSNNAYCSAE